MYLPDLLRKLWANCLYLALYICAPPVMPILRAHILQIEALPKKMRPAKQYKHYSYAKTHCLEKPHPLF